MNIPRPEHPNPQWERKKWKNLNGEWEFDFDFSKSAKERELYKCEKLSKKINVPFCPESKLSGIDYTDFIPSVCYRKEIMLSDTEISGKVILHFGAVDFHSFVYINSIFVGEHIGGYSSFEFDITKYVNCGKNVIFVIAQDETRSLSQPSGKQSVRLNSQGSSYTRTTGIWQTVWLEFVPKIYVKKCRYYPDIANMTLTVEGETCGSGELELLASYDGKSVGYTKLNVNGGFFISQISLSELHLWEIGCGRLYDLEIKFGNDVVKSYFGMREISFEGLKFMLNGKPLFMRTVLDQGFYPDGVYTAPDDETLKRDILLSKAVGFNGARLHQKVFEKRFLYHCDKEGYIVWGEHANWGIDYMDAVAQGNFMCEWAEILERDFNSPALIGWCPFNETLNYREAKNSFRFVESVYKMTKLFDKTRPCIDASGNYHINGKEIHDVHDYEQNTEKFFEYYSDIENGIVKDQIYRLEGDVQPYSGEPIFVSEYGGILWNPISSNGWGYGDSIKTEEEFIERYKALSETLLFNPYITGLCYTQLYDVEQEKNGLYYYDRTPKFNKEIMDKLKEIISQKAQIEK